MTNTKVIYFDILNKRLKEKADSILADLTSEDSSRTEQAMSFFQQFEQYHDVTANELVKKHKIKKKDILNLIAKSLNTADFSALKKRMKSPFSELDFSQATPLWFDKYSDAVSFLNKGHAVLLPYENRYVVIQLKDLEHIGLDKDEPNWEKIQYNWVYPGDCDALLSLFVKI